MQPEYNMKPIERKMYTNDNRIETRSNVFGGNPYPHRCVNDALSSRITLMQYRVKRNWWKYLKAMAGK